MNEWGLESIKLYLSKLIRPMICIQKCPNILSWFCFFFQQGQGLVQVHEGGRQPVGGGHEEALPDCWRAARGQAGAQVLDDGPQRAVQDTHVHRQSNESTENVTPSASGVVVTCDTLTAVLCTRTVRFSLEVLVYTKLAVMLLQCARVLFNCCDT